MSKVLEIKELSIKSAEDTLVDKLSLQLDTGQTLAIVGESGSGKSLTSLAIMGLLPPGLDVAGKILFQGKDLLKQGEKSLRNVRGKDIAMVFQEPMTALNPTMKCGEQVEELLRKDGRMKSKEAQEEVIRLFNKVELPRPDSIYHSFPHQISGGQKQRVVIAMALALKPKLLIADEPTTALDATVQLGILELLRSLISEFDMSMIFISHDLTVVHRVADQLLVMRKGVVRESGATDKIFQHPQDDYSRGLLACKPTFDTYFERLPVISQYEGGRRPKLKLLQREHRIDHANKLQQAKPLLRVSGVNKLFQGKRGLWSRIEAVQAVKDLDLQVFPGESLGLVGESGSGKTSLGRILSGLEKSTQGKIWFKGKDITRASRADWRKLHREIQIIFQDPYSSLNPRIKIGEAIGEAMLGLKDLNGAQRRKRTEQLLDKVGLGKEHYDRYPHEFSGGQRQRIGIARALAVKPKFIVCDESVSALDVSVQAQILNLLNDLKEEFGLTYLFISHDLSVVKYFCDRLLVLKEGVMVESGISEEVFSSPKMDYTKTLIEASHG